VERLDPTVRWLWGIGSVLTAVVLGVLVTGGARVFLPEWIWVGGVVAVLVAIAGVVFSVARYRRWRFELQDDALFIRHGVITHVRTVVPFVRVQHVDTQRGPLERALGLSSVVVYTAGSRSADVTIPGLTPKRADSLQARLREMAIESEREDAV
jgi:membrane protein YdbS with pleckstrin-like domain